jgi:hypothetical protein
MKLTARKTRVFIDIKVDEIETTVYKSNPKEVQEMIDNLLNVVYDLAGFTEHTVQEHVEILGL